MKNIEFALFQEKTAIHKRRYSSQYGDKIAEHGNKVTIFLLITYLSVVQVCITNNTTLSITCGDRFPGFGAQGMYIKEYRDGYQYNWLLSRYIRGKDSNTQTIIIQMLIRKRYPDITMISYLDAGSSILWQRMARNIQLSTRKE